MGVDGSLCSRRSPYRQVNSECMGDMHEPGQTEDLELSGRSHSALRAGSAYYGKIGGSGTTGIGQRSKTMASSAISRHSNTSRN